MPSPGPRTGTTDPQRTEWLRSYDLKKHLNLLIFNPTSLGFIFKGKFYY